jgi:branched-chain amino acid transport system ATP-binding protein
MSGAPSRELSAAAQNASAATPDGGPLISVRDVSKQFAGLRALNGIGFDVAADSITSIIGPNGAGKTTLFNVIAGSEPPTSGTVTFAGRTLTGLPPDEVCRRGVARTYQSARPFAGLSVRNNVRVALLYGRLTWPAAGDVEAEVERTLAFVHLTGKGARRAESLTPLDRKRLELARALATEPRLLLLDELIAGLTPTETGEMMETLRAINGRGVTILLIEHVMKAVMGLSHHVIVLHHGEKIAEGAPQAIAQDPAVIRAYLGDAAAKAGIA